MRVLEGLRDIVIVPDPVGDGVACWDADDDCTYKGKGSSASCVNSNRKHRSTDTKGHTWLFRPKAVWETVIDADCVGVALMLGLPDMVKLGVADPVTL